MIDRWFGAPPAGVDSPEAFPSHASIAVWPLLSPPIQVWVRQLFQPQRLHLPSASLSFCSLSRFLPSFLYVESTGLTELTLQPAFMSELDKKGLLQLWLSLLNAPPRFTTLRKGKYKGVVSLPCTPIIYLLPLLLCLLQVNAGHHTGDRRRTRRPIRAPNDVKIKV